MARATELDGGDPLTLTLPPSRVGGERSWTADLPEVLRVMRVLIDRHDLAPLDRRA